MFLEIREGADRIAGLLRLLNSVSTSSRMAANWARSKFVIFNVRQGADARGLAANISL